MSQSHLRIAALRSQLPSGVLAFGPDVPRLTWQLASDVANVEQEAYEIEASASETFLKVSAATGVVESRTQIGVAAPGGALRSREVRHYRVRVRADRGRSPWSKPLRLEAGLLDRTDWIAKAITYPGDPGEREQGPAPLFRRAFQLDELPRQARLYISSLGIHAAWLNGIAVGDQLLSPGWTSYGHRLEVDAHDVDALLTKGPNVLTAVLGDGWYRGRLGWPGGRDRGRYGSRVGLIAQLEMTFHDGRSVAVVSDESWRAAQGEIRRADLYDGALVDLRANHEGWDRPEFDDSDWPQATAINFDASTLEPRSTAPVRELERRALTLGRDQPGRITVDTGQNLAGFLHIRARGDAGDTVTVRHAEVREADGSLHTRALRSARATDQFILDGGSADLVPPFTFHGFRYADIETVADVLSADVVAISSDLPRRSSFECADERLNRLHENVLWSLRSNFVSVPTDCPQRDERLGWTGDAQAFASTASTLVEAEAFWQGWLRDLELDQDDVLGVPSVVPDVVMEGVARFGRAGWADAATIVPWAVYEAYGDSEILRRQFPSMRRWVESLMHRRDPNGLLVPSWQFGDWLDPDAPSDRPWLAKCDSDFIANSYFSWSARLLGQAALVIGERSAGDAFSALADQVARLTWERWAPTALENQTGCAIALVMEIAPQGERTRVGEALARLVDGADGRVGTGFLGTPLVLPALASEGKFASAYRMLMNTERPGWLYQIEHGATTMWERWDAILPDGTIHPGSMSPPPGTPSDEEGHMLSFNHYAYGAVIDWVYRHVAGLAPVRSDPGYRSVRLAPRPSEGIDWARATIDSRYGRVAIDWRIDGDRFIADIEVPPGATGTFVSPSTPRSTVVVDGETAVGTASDVGLRSGTHQVEVSWPAVIQTRG